MSFIQLPILIELNGNIPETYALLFLLRLPLLHPAEKEI